MGKKLIRTFKDVSGTGLKTNSPDDFLDFKFSYYLPETKDKIDRAVNELYIKIGKILEEDRKTAGKTG